MSKRILIIDDEESYGALIAEAAEDAGFVARAVTTAAAALEALESFRPDLAFVDLCLPDMDGIELIRRLGAHRATPRLVVMSGVDDRAINMAADLAERDGVPIADRLSKPFEIDDLMDLLDRERAALDHFRIDDIALIEAIQRDEIELHFQPVVDLRAGVGAGPAAVEASPRWRTRDDRLVLPEKFLPRIAHSDAESRLMLSLVERTCAALARWRASAPGLRAEIALPFSFLAAPRNLDAVIARHRRSGLGDAVTVLVPEPGLDDAGQTGAEIVSRLRLSGAAVALDSFGTGRMSLRSLSEPPFTGVKVDAAFLAEACERPDGARLLGTVAAMAGAMGLTLGARGVDTATMVEVLSACAFHRAQGAALGKAVPLAALDTRYAAAPTLAR